MKHALIIITIAILHTSGFAQDLIDKNATQETKALYSHLKKVALKGFMFGHQDTDAYGVNWKADQHRSDVKDVCGAYPAVHGWDLGNLGKPHNIDDVDFDNMHRWIKEAYERGGVNTVSWHVDNPTTHGNAWDKTPTVKNILPGGKDHAFFVEQLDRVADFLDHCVSGSTKIPIIFRPYHEHNGDWFWWGKGNCTEDEYVQLWKFTRDYLTDKKNLHNLIFAFSPDRSRLTMDNQRNMQNLKASYLYAYPGDAYVDLLGLDNYMDVGIGWNKKSKEDQQKDFVTGLQMVSALATEKNKVAALTETGLEGLPNPNWYTDVILKPILNNNDIHIAYMLVWRNANTKHHYAPYKGHPAEKDFLVFFDDDHTLFESDLKNMYGSD